MRELTLSDHEKKLAVKNASVISRKSFMSDLLLNLWKSFLHMDVSTDTVLCQREKSTENQSTNTKETVFRVKAFQVMIDNNLSHEIALYPYELVTYGETGQVCQNWMQYQLLKNILRF